MGFSKATILVPSSLLNQPLPWLFCECSPIQPSELHTKDCLCLLIFVINAGPSVVFWSLMFMGTSTSDNQVSLGALISQLIRELFS